MTAPDARQGVDPADLLALMSTRRVVRDFSA